MKGSFEPVASPANMEFKVIEPYDERGQSPATQLYNHARGLMDAGHTEEAITAFFQSAATYPHSKTYELIGECYARLRRFMDAIPFLAAATTLNRGVRAPSLLAEAWLALGRHDEAVEAADMALARDPRNRKALKIRADATAEMARRGEQNTEGLPQNDNAYLSAAGRKRRPQNEPPAALESQRTRSTDQRRQDWGGGASRKRRGSANVEC